jgi:hypothetical protein
MDIQVLCVLHSESDLSSMYTGAAVPSVIDNMLHTLMNQPFTEAYDTLNKVHTKITLTDFSLIIILIQGNDKLWLRLN